MLVDLTKEKSGYGQIGNNLKWYSRDTVIKPLDNKLGKVHVRKQVDTNLDMEGNAHEVEFQRYVSKNAGRIYGNQIPDMVEPPKRQTGFGGTNSGLDAIGFRFANKQNEIVKGVTSKYSI